MSCLWWKQFSNFDTFGTKISLNYKSDDSFRTTFGGIATLSIIVLFVLLFYDNFTPSVTYDQNPTLLEIGSDSFMIAVKYDQTNFIKRPMYNITFEKRLYQRFDNGTYLKNKELVQLEPCSLEHFNNIPSNGADWGQLFQKQNLSDFLCLPKNQIFNVGGKFESDKFYHLKYSMSKCVNATRTGSWQPICDTPDNIKAGTTQSSRINFILTNTILNPELISSTAQSYLDSQIYSVQPEKMYTTANIMLNEQIMSTDDSILPIEQIKEEKFIIYSQNDYKQSYSVGNFTNFCEIYFLRNSFSTVISRNYVKMEEVIGRLGGFCQVFILIAAVIVNYYNDIIYVIELANRLYDFDVSRKNGKNSKPLSNPQMNTLSHTPSQANIKQAPTNSFNNILKKNQEPTFFFDKKTKIIAQKSFAPDGKVLNREDLGLIPLDEIKKKLETKLTLNQKNQVQKNKDEDKMRTFNHPNQNHDQIQLYNNPSQINTFKNEFTLNIIPSQSQSNQLLNKSQNKNIEDYIEKYNMQKQDLQFTNNNESCKNQNLIQQEIEGNKTQYLYDSQSPNLIPATLSVQLKQTLTDQPIDLNQKNFNFDSRQTQTLQQRRRITTTTAQGGNDPNSFLDKELRFIIQRDRSINPTIKYFINRLTCGKLFNTQEVQMLNQADDKIRQDLDIFTILDRLKELEKFKSLFFTDEQRMLFNFFPKPLIRINDQSKQITRQQLKEEEAEKYIQNLQVLQKNKRTLNIQKGNIMMIQKAVMKLKRAGKRNQLTEYQILYNCYEKLIQQRLNKHDTSFNQRLIELLGDEMKKIFEITKLMKDKIDVKDNQSMNSSQKDSFILNQRFNLEENTKINDTLTKSVFNQKKEQSIDEVREDTFNKNEKGQVELSEQSENIQQKEQQIAFQKQIDIQDIIIQNPDNHIIIFDEDNDTLSDVEDDNKT